jgi:hypothetical protein
MVVIDTEYDLDFLHLVVVIHDSHKIDETNRTSAESDEMRTIR